MTQIDVASYTTTQLIILASNYEKLEENGTIGNCFLRSEAEKLMREKNENTRTSFNVTLWMEGLAFKVYQELYYRLAEMHDQVTTENAKLKEEIRKLKENNNKMSWQVSNARDEADANDRNTWR